MRGGERGGALPAALVLQLILLLVGLQIALAAGTVRLAVARSEAHLRAENLAAAAVALAAARDGASLAAALAAGDVIAVDLSPLGESVAGGEVRIHDDDDGDGDAAVDSNGRVFLTARVAVPAFPGTLPSRVELTRETLLAGALPLPGALVDCAGGIGLCGGDSGCAVPPGTIMGGPAAALAVPLERSAEMARALFVLTREVLRTAHGRCAAAACGAEDAAFLQAAATQVLRRLDLPDSDATGLGQAAVSRLVAGLLDLAGDETGSGTFPWWDGTLRAVPDMSVLPGAVVALGDPSGHTPSLAAHPYPRFLQGAHRQGHDAGLCRRLPTLAAVALERDAAGPAPPRVTVIAAPVTLDGGAVLEGSGLLVVRHRLTVTATGRLQWTGSVVLDGGALAGPGPAAIRGSLVILLPSAVGAVDLASTALQLQGDEAEHRRAWKMAGNVLLSSWNGSGAP